MAETPAFLQLLLPQYIPLADGVASIGLGTFFLIKRNPRRRQFYYDRAILRPVAILIIAVIIAISGLSAYLYVSLNNQYSTCIQSAESQYYLTVVNDTTNARLSGVSVSGNVKWLCGSEMSPGYFIASQNIGKVRTDPNGTILIGSIIGNYSLTLSYQGKSYPLKFSGKAEQNVNVTVRLPSNELIIIGCTFGGGVCFNETNPNQSTMITAITTTLSTTTAKSGSSNATDSRTFDFDYIPYNFTVGNFQVEMAYNATDYLPPSSTGTLTQYLGFVFAFNVTSPDGITKNVFFPWLYTDPCTSPEDKYTCIPQSRWTLPNPQNATISYDNNSTLLIAWNLNSRSLFVIFIIQPN